MIERIRELLNVRQLSPTQFADIIGIGRPVVSHILSGRNKASLEVVQKIIAAFPDLALPWLLTGDGSMLASTTAPEEQEPLKAAPNLGTTTQTRRREKVASKKELPAAQATAAIANGIPPTAKTEPPEHTSPALSVPPAPAVAPAPPPVASTSPLDALVNTEKAIRRIVIFYRDGTFADYQPEP